MNTQSTIGSKAFVSRLALSVWVLVVLVSTLAPLSGDMYETVAGIDKLVHIALFGGFALLLGINLHLRGFRDAVTVFLISTAFAGAIELIQGVLSYRSADVWDLIAGSGGAIAGLAVFLIANRRRSNAQGRTDPG